MTIYTVKSASELTSTLSKVQSGDTVQLAAGNYANVLIKGIKIAGNVTITSADPNSKAVINGLQVNSSSGFTFSHLDLNNTAVGTNNKFLVLGSSNIVLDHLTVHGPNNIGSGMESQLMMVRSSTNVTVSNSEFYHGFTGLSMLDTKGLTVSNNYFHDMRMDGVRGGGNSDLLVTKNTFTDFYPAALDHPDAIQLWTGNTSGSATNIKITDNLVVRGQGGPIQGVFMRDEVGNVPFQNVTITGNMITGGRYNGIAVNHVQGGTISDNVVAGFVGERSWIRADLSTNLNVANNASTFWSSGLSTQAGTNGNTLITEISDGGSAWVTNWLSKHAGFSSAWGGTDLGLLQTLGLTYDTSLLTGVTSPTSPTTSTPTTGTTTTPPPPTDTTTAPDTGGSTTTGGTGTTTGGTTTTTPQTLPGGSGDDVYFVRSLNDLVSEAVSGGRDTVHAFIDYTLGANVEELYLDVAGLKGTGNTLDNRIVGSSGIDTIYGMDGNDVVQGRLGDDLVYGGNGNDDLRGEDGNDKLFGDAGNDVLSGGVGNDILNGGVGVDRLEGGAGNDVMTGGAGKDVFMFRTWDFATKSVDQITDFVRGTDKISLSQVDLGGKDFNFIGTSNFHKTVGELRYQVQNGDAYVQGDINGDGAADFTIKVDKITKLTSSDFML